MKSKLLVLVAGLMFVASVNAQTNQTTPSSERSTNANSTEQAAELKEAESLRQQIFKLYEQKKFKEALPLAERALALTSRTLPGSDPLVTSAVINLAELHLALKEFSKAETLYQRILSAHEKEQPPDRKKLGEILERLALISYARSNFSRSESFYKRSLAAREQAFGSDSIQVKDVLYSLAEVHRFRYEFNKAEPLYRRALLIEDKTLGEKDARKTLDGLTCLLYESEQSDKLKALYEERRARYKISSNSKLSGGGVLNGRAVSLPRPPYPAQALHAGYSGIVVVKVTIDESGKVVKAEDHCGAVKPLAEAAIGAAYRARFTPTLLSGQPVKVTGTITYKFAR